MFYVYILLMSNDQLYFGFTPDLKECVKKHKNGKVFTTKKYLPVDLVYYESYLSKKDALDREYKLKRFGSSWSHLKQRLKFSLKDSQERGKKWA